MHLKIVEKYTIFFVKVSTKTVFSVTVRGGVAQNFAELLIVFFIDVFPKLIDQETMIEQIPGNYRMSYCPSVPNNAKKLEEIIKNKLFLFLPPPPSKNKIAIKLVTGYYSGFNFNPVTVLNRPGCLCRTTKEDRSNSTKLI